MIKPEATRCGEIFLHGSQEKVMSRLDLFGGTAQRLEVEVDWNVREVEMPTTVVDEEKRGIIEYATNEIGMQESKRFLCGAQFLSNKVHGVVQSEVDH